MKYTKLEPNFSRKVRCIHCIQFHKERKLSVFHPYFAFILSSFLLIPLTKNTFTFRRFKNKINKGRIKIWSRSLQAFQKYQIWNSVSRKMRLKFPKHSYPRNNLPNQLKIFKYMYRYICKNKILFLKIHKLI